MVDITNLGIDMGGFSGIGASIKLYGTIGLIIFILGLLVILVIYYRMFKLKVFIRKCYAENRYVWKNDKARRKRNALGVEEFKLFWRNRKFKSPKHFHRLEGMFGAKDVIFLSEDASGDFHEMNIIEGDLKMIPQDLMIWKVNEMNADYEKYRAKKETFWEKYGHVLVSYGGLAILFVMVVIILYYMKDVVAGFESASGNFAQNCLRQSSALPPPG